MTKIQHMTVLEEHRAAPFTIKLIKMWTGTHYVQIFRDGYEIPNERRFKQPKTGAEKATKYFNHLKEVYGE